MGASTKPRLSGMQLQILALYRGFLRVARTKSPEERSRIEALVSQEFRRNSSEVDRKNYLYIEYLVRRGKKQLDQLKSPETVEEIEDILAEDQDRRQITKVKPLPKLVIGLM